MVGAREYRRPGTRTNGAIAGADSAYVTSRTQEGTGFVVTAPALEFARRSGPMPVTRAHERDRHPVAPVIQTVVVVLDDPPDPSAAETFTNIADPSQREDFAQLAERETAAVPCYDERRPRRLDKRLTMGGGTDLALVMAEAEQAEPHLTAPCQLSRRARASS